MKKRTRIGKNIRPNVGSTISPTEPPAASQWRRASSLILLALISGCSTAVVPGEEEQTGSAVQKLTGNISPNVIQIDGPDPGFPANSPPGADLYSNVGTPLNAPANADWVADSNANSGSGCLQADGSATCIQANITGATGGTGHWNGLRIIDGFAGSDLDIFLSGGKENDTATWNIGPGSVGSSKYDITQAYLANNQANLYFGMERRGNNGTTAFDFEFNQLAPKTGSCPQNAQIPCRSIGDVLFTFEMSGSGSSGSATPHIFTWNGTTYNEGAAGSIVSSINNSASTAGGPWGHVDAQGNWVLGNLDRFTFAEAAAPVALLPGVNSCGGKAFVQIRTRSSSTANSDLKDTTKVFEFLFNNASATAMLTPSCDQGFNFTASGTDAGGNAIANPVCKWTFSDGGTSDSCAGFHAAAVGTYTGTVEVTDPLSPSCKATKTTASVDVYAVLSVSADLVATCSSKLTYDATPSGGSNPAGVTYAWTFSGGGTVSPASSIVKSGSVNVGTSGVLYTGNVQITDPRTDIVCKANASDSAKPFSPLSVDLALQAAPQTCPGMTSDSVTYNAVPSGGNGQYSFTWSGAACSGASCVINPADATFCAEQSLSVAVSDSSGICPAAASEVETYTKVTTISASNNP